MAATASTTTPAMAPMSSLRKTLSLLRGTGTRRLSQSRRTRGVRVGRTLENPTHSGKRSCGMLSPRVRPPADPPIPAPEMPPGVAWLNAPFVRVDTLLGRHALLIEFWDFARINSLRTLPYVKAWHERYAEAGLAVLGVHTPGYGFGRE